MYNKMNMLSATIAMLFIGGCQAFAPADLAALQAAVGTCTKSGNTYPCTGGCLGETPDGSCPNFAASNDATGNPYGVIGDWDVSQVTDFTHLFRYATVFNQDISNWDVSKVTNMLFSFNHAFAFNQDISQWDVSKVTTMQGAFAFTNFNFDIGNWDVSQVTKMGYMFYNSGFDRTLCGGKWLTGGADGAFDRVGSSTARYGCCDAGSYMSNPHLNPFSQATSCSPCSFTGAPNDDTSCAGR